MADVFATLVKKWLFEDFAVVCGSSSAGKGSSDTITDRKTLNPFALGKGITPGWIPLRKFCCRHGMM